MVKVDFYITIPGLFWKEITTQEGHKRTLQFCFSDICSCNVLLISNSCFIRTFQDNVLSWFLVTIVNVRNVETVMWCVSLLQKVSVPDISLLPVPLTESDAKQTNTRQSSRYCCSNRPDICRFVETWDACHMVWVSVLMSDFLRSKSAAALSGAAVCVSNSRIVCSAYCVLNCYHFLSFTLTSRCSTFCDLTVRFFALP